MWGQGRGFTLLELMVVLAIIASLTAAFPLAMNRFVPARRVDAAARQLLADLRLAQARASSSDRIVALVPLAHGYEVHDPGGRVPVQSRSWRDSTSLTLSAADGLPVQELRLYSDGSSSGGRFVIRDGGHERSVAVSGLTGRTRLDHSPPLAGHPP